MQFTLFAVAATFISAVSAQAGLPDCAKSCVTKFTTGAEIGGCANLDIACICSSTTFLQGIACCLQSSCDTADQASAVTYAKTLCLTAGVTVPDSISSLCTTNSTSSSTSSASSTASTTATHTTSSTATSATVAATSSAAAAQMIVGGAGVVGGLAALLAFL